MLINKHIGFDADEGQGIDGSSFQSELMWLDGLGKTRIEVYINSPGGNVLDGWNIFSAISHSKTPVDTYNVGMCASIAGVIFMAGRKRYAADYSLFMMHNPFIPGDESSDNEGMQKIKESLVKQIASNSNMSEDQVSNLMDATTWMNADECMSCGIATEIISTTQTNKKYLPKTSDSKALWKQYAGIENSILNKNTVMKNVANFLKLNENSNEDAILSAVKDLANVADAANKSKTEIKEEMDKLKEQYDALKAQYDKMTNDMEEAENAAKEAKKAQALVEAKAYVNSHVGVRITNDEKAITAWVNKYVEDAEGTKTMIESIPVNAKANNMNPSGGATGEKYTAGFINVMNQAKAIAGN